MVWQRFSTELAQLSKIIQNTMEIKYWRLEYFKIICNHKLFIQSTCYAESSLLEKSCGERMNARLTAIVGIMCMCVDNTKKYFPKN